MKLHRYVIRHIVAIAISLCAVVTQASDLTGKVVGVADGDTITLLDSQNTQHKIRLSGIVAPEKGMPFGQRSKESLSDLVFGKMVEIEGNKIDRYGRRVGKIIHEGKDINLIQVERGFAWHYKEYANEQNRNDQLLYTSAEGQARTSRRGLWIDPNPQPPWEWRKAKRGSK